MTLNGAISLHGVVTLRHIRNGQILSEETLNNTTTVTGKAETAGLFNETRTGGFKYIAVGSSGTVASTANTGLTTEITAAGLARVTATCTRVNTDATNDTAQLFHTFTATNTQAVREVGIFDSAAVGVMAGRSTFAVKNMAANDILQCTYKIKFG